MKRDPGIVLESARLEIRKKWPFMLSSVYALTPVAVEEIQTSCLTPGMVFGYNPHFISELTDAEAAFVMLHEVFHYRLKFFDQVAVLGQELAAIVNDAQDCVINVQLRDGGWPVFKWALVPAKFGLPEGLTTAEYVDLMLQKKPPPQGGGAQGKGPPKQGQNQQSQGGQGGQPGQQQQQGGGGGQSQQQGHERGVCNGGCSANKTLQQKLDEMFGRSESNVKAVERRTAHEIQKHIEKQKGRGKVPGWMEEWAKTILEEPSTINWRDILGRIVRDACGRIMSGGDDFSLRRPSKRSHVRRIMRPGLIEHEILPLFVMDTSGSMDVQQMLAGIRETCAILRQVGVEDAYYMEVDAAVTLEPQLVNLSFFEKEMKFTGRGGTSFIPAFEALKRMSNKPDIMFYWTDGDGCAPPSPPPNVEVVWGLVPGSYRTTRPARWGHLVVISDDPTKQKFFEEAATYEEADEDEYADDI